MDTNKMREQTEKQFDAFFVEYERKREANGWMPLETYVLAHMRAAWIASREAVVVELPEPDLPEANLDEPVDRESEEFRYLEARHGAQCQTYRKCRAAIEAQGLKVAG
ncbi:hypothetical protein P5705_05005 [Pseudomonas entomophila]|uniref:hypothetical protein n=1 Tax=Pseudomonas entomophila TaxID=312306 RepID=UPI0024059D31|nr:hypothetical protein [Pseudomonas entomophila]MDF9616991.1 hypothetical protein [Pseudomonas entomophila]